MQNEKKSYFFITEAELDTLLMAYTEELLDEMNANSTTSPEFRKRMREIAERYIAVYDAWTELRN